MIRDRTIIAIASNWHFDPTSKHHVMRVLSEHNDILWVNYHGSRRPTASASDVRRIATKLRQVARGVERLAPRISVLTPLLLPAPASATARRINQALVVKQIRRALRGLPDQPVQLWSFAPDVDYLVGAFGEELDLYYCVDEFSAFSDYDAETIRRLEADLIARSDIVLTTAADLQSAKRSMHPQTHLVLHGVDHAHFAAASEPGPRPLAARNISGPVFGFFGMIQDWVDVDLVCAVAERNPQWSFVLLGKAAVSVQRCMALPNVHVPGQVPYADLPAWCRVFDVGLIPFKINELTRHVNPIKLREYLAAGLPVVSTPLPEVQAYRPHVAVGDGVDGFESACRQALGRRSAAHSAERRQAMALETWAHKVEHISRLVAALDTSTATCPV